MDTLAAGIAPVIKDLMAPLFARIADLERRLETVKAGEPGPPGEVGPPGPQGLAGTTGRDGQPGIPGRDGAKGSDGVDGKNGADGKDGLGFDDMDVVFDEATGYVIRFRRGDEVKEFPVAIPWDAGIWEAGKVYPKGAVLRRDGSWWIAQTQTSAQPGHDKTWRLAVKKGTDGRQGQVGPEGSRGPKGEQGLPGPARY
jgi:integrin beta 3